MACLPIGTKCLNLDIGAQVRQMAVPKNIVLQA